MEILIVVAIMTVVVKRGVEDVIHAARGNTPARYAAASARRKSGAAGKYWSSVWDDVWTDLHKRHVAKRSDPSRPRGAATVFWSNLWRDGWVAAERRRQGKATRPRPETVTVPGEVVPDFEDGPEDGDGSRSVPDPHIVPTEDGRTDLTFGDDPTDPTGVSSCPECGGTGVTEDGVCLSCRDRQEQRNQHWDGRSVPDYVPDFGPDQDIDPSPAVPHQEGTIMTATTTEVTGLDAAIKWCEDSTEQYRAEITSAEATGAHCSTLAKSYRAQVVATEAVEASITGAGVTGPALARLTAVREKADAAAWAMERAEAEFATVRELADTAAADCEAVAAEFRAFKPGQEFYDARPDAPGREFLTAGR